MTDRSSTPAEATSTCPTCDTRFPDGRRCGEVAVMRLRFTNRQDNQWWNHCETHYNDWNSKWSRYGQPGHVEVQVFNPPSDEPMDEPPMEEPEAAAPEPCIFVVEPEDVPEEQPAESELVVLLDLETTGPDIAVDRIVQFAAHRFWVGAEPGPAVETSDCLTFLCNPGIPISAEATAVHGITNEQVRGLPRFAHYAPQIAEFLGGLPLAGFNILGFDWPMLWEEMMRAGIQLDDRPVIDAFNIFRRREERTLSAAVRFYCGREHEDAHDALADVTATGEVLIGQIERYPDLGRTVAELAQASQFEPRVDIAGKFTRNAEGVICYAFGKNKGRPVASDVSYARWIAQDAGFTQQTKMVLREIMEGRLS